MFQLSLNSENGLPLVDQIVSGVRTQIDDRVLRPGMKLPPIRRMAETHRISRFTVVEAYDRLVALGYLQSRRGSGFYVSPRRTVAAIEKESPQVERAIDAAWLMREISVDTPERLPVGAGCLPADWLDEEGVLRNLRGLARRPDSRVTSYGTSQGYAPLRQQLQVKLAELAIGARAEQIVLTHGATQALDLVARYFLKAGDCVLVDDPGYWNLFANLRLYGVRLVGVPRTLDGPDVHALEELLRHHKPKLFFTQSVLHNPTSGNLSPANAFRILQLAEKHNFLIVEDDICGDHYPGPTTRLAVFDQLQRVIYVGSFSKTVSGNLRVGFLACQQDLAHALTDVKIVSFISSSEFAERLAYRMLTEGHYRKYIERVQARLAEATHATLRMLERTGLKLDAEPKGGMFVWAQVPGLQDSAALARRAIREGIVLAPGNVFRPQSQPSPYLRFNVAYATDKRLERFLARRDG
ncbi:MAG: PLP-dependent aminotransferase family protein [Pseudomonadota bacterium]|jgi:DNA-binding transcriptional MocR family regulator